MGDITPEASVPFSTGHAPKPTSSFPTETGRDAVALPLASLLGSQLDQPSVSPYPDPGVTSG